MKNLTVHKGKWTLGRALCPSFAASNQIRQGAFAPRFYRASLDKIPLKICGAAGDFNFIQPGFAPH
ncbi:hypothetical protein [Siminovitchia terrae]|uniref:Uncharacterized protein n=1 Tax=Siminovitchia terrae TaxID=1914933 RepID=A0A429X5L9_SIMTE|nr:hypothetical protein [Siminovitchia terrae]RST58738.1 hypothetical protein D5F11_015985 [Siminovitchia terrae]